VSFGRQEAVESVELDTVLNMDVHSKLHVLYGGTKVVQHTPPSKTSPGLKGLNMIPRFIDNDLSLTATLN